MEPATTAALITGGSALLSGGANAMSTASVNSRTRRWNEKMYAQQRDDAIKNWNLQNEYNSPTSQMNRLREANLNPNLVYGNGTVANSATAPDTGKPMAWTPQAPKANLGQVAGDAINTHFNVQERTQSIDLLKRQNTIMDEEIRLKRLEGDQKQLDYDIDLLHSGDFRRHQVRKALNDADKSQFDASYRESELGNYLELSGLTGDNNSRFNRIIEAADLDNKIKKEIYRFKSVESQLAEQGIFKGDEIWNREISGQFGGYGGLIDYVRKGGIRKLPQLIKRK